MKAFNRFLILGLAVLLTACGGEKGNSGKSHDSDYRQETPADSLSEENYSAKADIDWVKNAVIYEVNVRQYSPEGDFAGFEKHLPRLKKLGVDILWFMPIHPIGVKNRKETEESLGSYYAVKDYKGVNPDLGSLEEFKALVGKCHDMGFKVVLDWVANHSAPDNAWVEEHPDFYTKDEEGNYPIAPVGTDWWDVADLNYDNPDLRAAMVDAMKFWVDECDIDGFRCDVAGEVPLDFWQETIKELRGMKEIFMLAEWDDPKMHSCFNATYGWGFHHALMEVGKGHWTLDSLRKQMLDDNARFTEGAFKLRFTTNHDENTWKGTEESLFGKNTKNFQALIFAAPGMPLMYSGQESVLDKQLEFFEKDEIDWKSYELAPFFKKLDEVREANPAIWGGEWGGSFMFLGGDSSNGVMAFERSRDNNRIRFIMNCSDSEQDISQYLDDSPNDISLMDNTVFAGPTLSAHEFIMLEMKD